MKKTIAIMLCLIFLISATGCRNQNNVSEDDTLLGAVKWFDTLQDDEIIAYGIRETTLNEYPDVTFRCSYEKIEAVTEEIVPLYWGMPIWSVYFSDLTGDGKPELCSTISMGSGLVDSRIIVYDYAAGKSYELSDRGNFDFRLNLSDNKLVVEKYQFMQDELLSVEELAINNLGIQIADTE